MTAKVRERILRAIKSDLGNASDNLYRAKAAFRGRTPDQMQQHYRQSGESCQSILDGYQHWHDEAAEALREVEKL